ncbi:MULTISPECIES: hypothetical protein [Clostridium]|uniref:Uncharacterized protein n=1 Tax=Clostridium disporicum TaxID=84024 RepID=A0A174GX90_9CLOT|nr:MULTISPECIES: hypothetical protein [Clostridium]MDU7454634.1 hypothetical protein [Clostridium saudiense]CUO65400.1 Uncharacterised protein [Clostridium disporicum]
MALVHRKRINSTLTSDNFDFITNLSKETGLNQSKLFDLSVDLLKRELNNKDFLSLFNEFNSNSKE